MLPKSKVLIDLINRRAYRNSRCSMDTYKDTSQPQAGSSYRKAVRKKNIQWIFLALSQLEGWEIDVAYIEEKSTEVIVPTGKRAVKSRGLTKLGRTERIVK